MTRTWPWIPLLAVLLVAGCGKDSSRKNEPITFRVNPDRLGERFERPGTGLTLRAPAGWDALPESLVSAAMDRLRATGTGIGTTEPEMLALYRGAPEGATLAV
ncbi:MAG: hypothetical protein ABIS67_11155, partial [Candidatus Eisenbacteria bacterium]